MTLEVTASFTNRNVFVAGEKLRSTIIFRNLDPLHCSDVIAWASAQYLCQCWLSKSRRQLKNVQNKSTTENLMADYSATPSTAFVPNQGEEGITVLCNKPKILFCNLTLKPGESKVCHYKDSIAFDAPPSYRGRSIKYTYKLVIGVQKFHSTAQLLRLPFRVLSMSALTEATVYQLTHNQMSPVNPFALDDNIHSDEESAVVPVLSHGRRFLQSKLMEKHEEQENNDFFEAYFQLLASATGRKQLLNYNLSTSAGNVFRLTMVKNSFKLGEDVIGVLDFSEATVPCLSLHIYLQSEEVDLVDNQSNSNDVHGRLTTHHEEHMDCLSMAQTHLSINVPSYCTPSFQTDLVLLRWRLRFEFVVPRAADQLKFDAFYPHENGETSDKRYWHPPILVENETLHWEFPLVVYPNKLTTFSHTVESLQSQMIC